jgi:hypothetical protein
VVACDDCDILTARVALLRRADAAYAICLQRDQYNRCTVGQMNWVPSVRVIVMVPCFLSLSMPRVPC